MVPPEYSGYFTTMASVAATLFGLIFLVVSITPESIAAESAPLDRQLKASAAYVALSNPLIVALFALLPHQELGPAILAAGAAGSLHMLAMARLLFRNPAERPFRLRNGMFILAGFVLYGFELDCGRRLLQSPSDSSVFYTLSTVLIFMILFGVARAWELVGGRRFHIRDWTSAGRVNSQEVDQRDKDAGKTGKGK